jgi:tight adherence protein B
VPHLLAIGFVVALALNFAFFLVAMRPGNSSKVARQRLATIRDSLRSTKAVAYGDDLGQVARQSCSDRIGAFLERYRFSQNLSALLIHAGSSKSVGDTVLACAGCGLACGMASYCFLHSVALESGVGIAGALIPIALLRFKRGRRIKAFNAALPDAIDLMARSLLAGHSMGSSIELVASQSPEPLAFEFVQVYQQQRLGLHFRDALLQMGSRVPSRDLQFLVTAILVQKETGGDLTEILARASHVIRDRVRIEGEVRTHTAQGRLTGWVLGLLPIVILVIINLLSPGYSDILFHDPIGLRLLYAGGIFIVVGGLVIRRIVDVQV